MNAEISGTMLEMTGAVFTICANGKGLAETFTAESEKYILQLKENRIRQNPKKPTKSISIAVYNRNTY